MNDTTVVEGGDYPPDDAPLDYRDDPDGALLQQAADLLANASPSRALPGVDAETWTNAAYVWRDAFHRRLTARRWAAVVRSMAVTQTAAIKRAEKQYREMNALIEQARADGCTETELSAAIKAGQAEWAARNQHTHEETTPA